MAIEGADWSMHLGLAKLVKVPVEIDEAHDISPEL